jgi:site-specific recombinase XerD
MLSKIIRRGDFQAKYRATFGHELVDEYAARLLARGYTRHSIKHILRDGKTFVEWGRAKRFAWAAFDDDAVRRFDARNRGCTHDIRLARRTNALHFVEFLRDRGIVAPAVLIAAPRPFLPFEEWMLGHRGATPSTVELYVSVLERKVFAPAGTPPAQLEPRSIRSAVLRAASGWSVSHAATIVSATRAYIRFAAAQGQCLVTLVGAIPRVAQWRLATLPRHIAAVDVERVIATCDTKTTRGRRDRAVLLLLARLGLRAGDVSTLRLDALDWREGRLRVSGKGRRGDWLPIPQDVGDAILAYLEKDRPSLTSPRVFLSTHAPIHPIESNTISGIAAHAVARSGVDAPVRGAHLFRHSVAVALLNRGVGLERIAAVLRHATLDSTEIYAKVDRRSLATIATRWPQTRVCRLPHQHVIDSDLRGIAGTWPQSSSQGGV